MNEINTSDLLSQIRTLNAELQAPAGSPATPATQGIGFGALLRNSMDSVNAAQSNATDLKTAFELGTTDKTLAEVMIASQKADLSFRAMTEVRNKLITAYQDIMNMPV